MEKTLHDFGWRYSHSDDVGARGFDDYDHIYDGLPQPLGAKCAEFHYELDWQGRKSGLDFPSFTPVLSGAYYTKYAFVSHDIRSRSQNRVITALFQEIALKCGLRIYKMEVLRHTVWCHSTYMKDAYQKRKAP